MVVHREYKRHLNWYQVYTIPYFLFRILLTDVADRSLLSPQAWQAWQAGQAGKPAQGLASWLFGITMLRHGLPDYHQITRLLYYSWWQAQQAL